MSQHLRVLPLLFHYSLCRFCVITEWVGSEHHGHELHMTDRNFLAVLFDVDCSAVIDFRDETFLHDYPFRKEKTCVFAQVPLGYY